ncbi:MAG: hypothetical protein NZ893_02635 [Candidatus Aenigmarchaeota archaeon]|nr:hypothetical protein [Candidatus Aenigmarchaeota archaeon]
MEEKTSIKISISTKKALEKLKVHPRQPYDEVIKKLLEEWLKNEMVRNKRRKFDKS